MAVHITSDHLDIHLACRHLLEVVDQVAPEWQTVTFGGIYIRRDQVLREVLRNFAEKSAE